MIPNMLGQPAGADPRGDAKMRATDPARTDATSDAAAFQELVDPPPAARPALQPEQVLPAEEPALLPDHAPPLAEAEAVLLPAETPVEALSGDQTEDAPDQADDSIVVPDVEAAGIQQFVAVLPQQSQKTPPVTMVQAMIEGVFTKDGTLMFTTVQPAEVTPQVAPETTPPEPEQRAPTAATIIPLPDQKPAPAMTQTIAGTVATVLERRHQKSLEDGLAPVFERIEKAMAAAAPAQPAPVATLSAPPNAPVTPAIAPPQMVLAPQAVVPGRDAVQPRSDMAEELQLAFGGTDRPLQTMVTPTAASPTAGIETARHVANQMAVAISTNQGRTTEIALNPRELGRVTLSLAAVDGAITLNILSERPETSDLMRRNIDTLAQEFRDLGYRDISFQFSHGGSAQQQGRPAETDPEGQQRALDPALAAPQVRTVMINGGLDLRL